MNYADARYMAEWLAGELKPGCERIEIGGGLRRGKADVHDIEIVAIPAFSTSADLFGVAIASASNLDGRLNVLEGLGALKRVKGGEKFKQFEIGRWEEFSITPPPQPFKLDLFLVTPPAQFGVDFMIRTGPGLKDNNFSQWIVTSRSKGGALPNGYRVKHAAVWRMDQLDEKGEPFQGEKPLPMPEEMDFFRFLELGYIEPGQRKARWMR